MGDETDRMVRLAIVKGSGALHVMTGLEDRTGYALLLCQRPEAFLEQAFLVPSLEDGLDNIERGVCAECRKEHEQQ